MTTVTNRPPRPVDAPEPDGEILQVSHYVHFEHGEAVQAGQRS